MKKLTILLALTISIASISQGTFGPEFPYSKAAGKYYNPQTASFDLNTNPYNISPYRPSTPAPMTKPGEFSNYAQGPARPSTPAPMNTPKAVNSGNPWSSASPSYETPTSTRSIGSYRNSSPTRPSTESATGNISTYENPESNPENWTMLEGSPFTQYDNTVTGTSYAYNPQTGKAYKYNPETRSFEDTTEPMPNVQGNTAMPQLPENTPPINNPIEANAATTGAETGYAGNIVPESGNINSYQNPAELNEQNWMMSEEGPINRYYNNATGTSYAHDTETGTSYKYNPETANYEETTEPMPQLTGNTAPARPSTPAPMTKPTEAEGEGLLSSNTGGNGLFSSNTAGESNSLFTSNASNAAQAGEAGASEAGEAGEVASGLGEAGEAASGLGEAEGVLGSIEEFAPLAEMAAI